MPLGSALVSVPAGSRRRICRSITPSLQAPASGAVYSPLRKNLALQVSAVHCTDCSSTPEDSSARVARTVNATLPGGVLESAIQREVVAQAEVDAAPPVGRQVLRPAGIDGHDVLQVEGCHPPACRTGFPGRGTGPPRLVVVVEFLADGRLQRVAVDVPASPEKLPLPSKQAVTGSRPLNGTPIASFTLMS